MRVRTWVFLGALFGMFGAAFILQGHISRKEVQAGPPRIPRENRLSLLLGGNAPLLKLPRSETRGRKAPLPPSPRAHPSPKQPSPPLPGSSAETRPPAPKRWVELQKGQTIYGICAEVLKDPSKLGEVLELNGWTREEARRLRAGTRVILPPPR